MHVVTSKSPKKNDSDTTKCIVIGIHGLRCDKTKGATKDVPFCSKCLQESDAEYMAIMDRCYHVCDTGLLCGKEVYGDYYGCKDHYKMLQKLHTDYSMKMLGGDVVQERECINYIASKGDYCHSKVESTESVYCRDCIHSRNTACTKHNVNIN